MSDVERLSDESLSTVSRLAALAVNLQARVTLKEIELKSAEDELRRVVEESLPLAMFEIGLSELTLEDGSSISVIESVHAGIPKASEADAFHWLRSHDLGDVIKNELIASFGRGEDSKAKALLDLMRTAGYTYKQRESVHPGTLKALAREKIVAGDPLPEDLFGVHIINRAIIKGSN